MFLSLTANSARPSSLTLLVYGAFTCRAMSFQIDVRFPARSHGASHGYQDGVDPSDGLTAHKTRKGAIFYWSFLELGDALHNESVWFEIGYIRSSQLKSVDDGIAQMTHLVASSLHGGTWGL